MTSCEPAIGDLWLTYLHFPDHPDIGKVRPVLILHIEEDNLVTAKVTSKDLAATCVSHIFVDDWLDAGLRKPSWIRMDPLFKVRKRDLLRDEPLGRVSNALLEAVLEEVSRASEPTPPRL